MKINWFYVGGGIMILSLIALGVGGVMQINKQTNDYRTFEETINIDNTPLENLKICNEYTTYSIKECIDIIDSYHKLLKEEN